MTLNERFGIDHVHEERAGLGRWRRNGEGVPVTAASCSHQQVQMETLLPSTTQNHTGCRAERHPFRESGNPLDYFFQVTKQQTSAFSSLAVTPFCTPGRVMTGGQPRKLRTAVGAQTPRRRYVSASPCPLEEEGVWRICTSHPGQTWG